jgi:hypothetical protein
MSDFQERLKAADPAAGPPYAHHDGEAMVSRIIAQHPARRRSVLRDFQLKMAGAVTVATLVTVGGIAAMDSAIPGLPVLALASAHNKSTDFAPSATGTMMRLYEEFHFSAGPDLSAAASTGPAYRLQFPSSGSAEVARVASIFKVAGSTVAPTSSNEAWTITDATGPSVTYDSYQGVPVWTYSSNTAGDAVSSPPASGGAVATSVPSHAALETVARGFLGQLGYGYAVSSPQFSAETGNSTSVGGTATTTIDWGTVSYNVVVDGMMTDQTVQFTIDSHNQVVSASGPAFSVASTLSYPLQSQVDGVAVLNAQQQSYFAGSGSSTSVPSGGGIVVPQPSGSSTGPTSPTSGSSGSSTGVTTPPGPPAGSITTPTDTPTPSGPPIVDVTLDAVNVTLGSFTLSDGSVWLLPVYTYTGRVPNSDGTSNWSTIAIDPAYVQLSDTSGVTPGGPIAY